MLIILIALIGNIVLTYFVARLCSRAESALDNESNTVRGLLLVHAKDRILDYKEHLKLIYLTLALELFTILYVQNTPTQVALTFIAYLTLTVYLTYLLIVFREFVKRYEL